MRKTAKKPRKKAKKKRPRGITKPQSLPQIIARLYPEMAARRRRYRILDSLSYLDYLWTEEWRRFRAGILKRDSFRCQKCGTSAGQLQVHHHHYRRIKRERPEDCVTLCESCHVLEEEWIKANGRRWEPKTRRRQSVYRR